MEIAAFTRSTVKKNHAVICPDGYVRSQIPGWTDCAVYVIANEAMGAGLCQVITVFGQGGRITGTTRCSEIFFYVLGGRCTVLVDQKEEQLLTEGQFLYVPTERQYSFERAEPGTEILSFHKTYEPLEGQAVPDTLFGDAGTIESNTLQSEVAVQIRLLLPDNPSFDMAVNILTLEPGGHLPFVETHIMEHGLLFLQGQAIYMLDQHWYPIKKGDALWIAPYCSQWVAAIGNQPASYIYYKNVNRFPIVI